MMMRKKMGYKYVREELVSKISEAVKHTKVFTVV